MDGKPWYQSKTMWFNLASVILGTADQLAGTGILGAHGVAIVGAANMILRAVTSTPIGAAK